MTLLLWTMNDLRECIEGKLLKKFAPFIVIDANGAIDKFRISKSTLAYKICQGLRIEWLFAILKVLLENPGLSYEELKSGFNAEEIFIEKCLEVLKFIGYVDDNYSLTDKGKSWILEFKNENILSFKPMRDLVFERKESIKHIVNKRFGKIISDEGAASGYKRNFYEVEQKELITSLNMFADHYNVYILVIGNFWDLDEALRKMCSLRISCLERGLALIQMPVASIYGNDPWETKYNMKIEKEWTESKSKKPQYSRLSTCVGILRFGDLPSAQRTLYEQVKKLKRNKASAKYMTSQVSDDPEKMFYDNLIKRMKEGKMNPEAFKIVCDITGKNNEAVRLKVNRILKGQGDDNRFSNYVMSDEKKRRKDSLGFALPMEVKN